MMMDWLWKNAATVKDLATSAGVLGTFIGILFGVWRFRIERRLQREVNAKRTYAGVLRMSFENPDFAEPERPMHTEAQHRKRYIWFVSNVLNALDEILLSTDDTIWRETAGVLLKHHAAWLATDEFRTTELPSYGDELRAIINRVTKATARAA
jgi:hypothetical protein